MEEPHKCCLIQSGCFRHIFLFEFTSNFDSEEGIRSSSITAKTPITHSPFSSVSLELSGLVDFSCSSKALLMFSDAWLAVLDSISDLCNCSNTACAIGTIMAVVAVLLIHIDRKAVTVMKPMRSLKWKGLKKSVQNSVLQCSFFLLQSFGYKCWVLKMLSHSHLALLLTLVCFVNDMVRFIINFSFCSFSQLCFYILMTSSGS